MGKDLTRQRTQDREMVAWKLRTSGLTQIEVAERIGISQPAVSKILSRVGERLAGEFVEEVRAQKAAQTAILEQIASKALSAWERSCEDAVTEQVVKGKTGGEDGKAKAQVTRTTSGQSGNPSLLAQARGALADIRDLWGMNAPLRQEHSGPGGGPIPIVREVEVVLPSVALEPAESRGDRAADPADEATELREEPVPALPRYPGGLEVIVDLDNGIVDLDNGGERRE